MKHPGQLLREEISGASDVEPFLGIYDCHSARIAARHSSNLFLSGFGFSASYYGLPDVGYVSWSDMVGTAWRIRQLLPGQKLLVDIDDGYVDVHTACHVARQMERMGVAMVMLEDQARPRRCGHVDGKQLLPLADYLEKLNAVLACRDEMCVLARTDASGSDIYRRVDAMSKTDADAILVDGIDSVDTLVRVLGCTGKPLLFNQIAGGKSPRISISELRRLGVKMVQYSTPMLFAAHFAMGRALQTLLENDGLISYDPTRGDIGVTECTMFLEEGIG